jgi:hypothetical protein
MLSALVVPSDMVPFRRPAWMIQYFVGGGMRQGMQLMTRWSSDALKHALEKGPFLSFGRHMKHVRT